MLTKHLKNATRLSLKYYYMTILFIFMNLFNWFYNLFKYWNLFTYQIIMLIFLFTELIFIIPGIYNFFQFKLKSKKYKTKDFLNSIKKYYKSFFQILVYAGLFGFIALIPISIISAKINNKLVASSFRQIMFMIYGLLTVYIIPIIILRKVSGWNAIFFSLEYLFRNIKKNVVWLIVFGGRSLIMIIMNYLKFHFSYDTFNYWFISFISSSINNYLRLIIFIIALQVLREDNVDQYLLSYEEEDINKQM